MQYISVANQKTLDQSFRVSAIIGLAFCFTPLLLMGLGYFLNASGRGVVDYAALGLFNKAVYGGALVIGLMVVALRRYWLGSLLKAQRQRPIPAVLGSLRVLALVSAALGELVAIMGFIAFSLTGNYEYCLRLGVVGLLLLFYSFPRRWEWERALAAHAQD